MTVSRNVYFSLPDFAGNPPDGYLATDAEFDVSGKTVYCTDPGEITSVHDGCVLHPGNYFEGILIDGIELEVQHMADEIAEELYDQSISADADLWVEPLLDRQLAAMALK